ncbi:hypothetical protein [Microtetraspora fusca]|uniref:Uncharacterized protein n=1 Tax=Microtetraspora fusca TaxID=1997 RepID=A0ABW6V4Z6_MICFU|nr:hypothetical protein [Microtetraspora fusca]
MVLVTNPDRLCPRTLQAALVYINIGGTSYQSGGLVGKWLKKGKTWWKDAHQFHCASPAFLPVLMHERSRGSACRAPAARGRR